MRLFAILSTLILLATTLLAETSKPNGGGDPKAVAARLTTVDWTDTVNALEPLLAPESSSVVPAIESRAGQAAGRMSYLAGELGQRSCRLLRLGSFTEEQSHDR